MEPPILLYGSLDSSISAVRQAAGEKAGCEAGQEGPQGGWRGVMNYGRGPGAPVGGQHLYHATRAGRRGMAVIQ